MFTKLRLAFPVLAAGLAVACGGGDGDVESVFIPGGFHDQSVGGIWEGTTAAGQQIYGLATEAGDFHFISDDGVQYFGDASATGNVLSGSFAGVTEDGTTFQDGTTYGTGDLTGQVMTRASLSGTGTFTTSAGTVFGSQFNLTYNSLYERPSGLATIAGSYTDTATSSLVTIDTAGAVSSVDAITSCVIAGTVAVVDPLYNAYDVSYTYTGCVAPADVLNGLTFTGIATLDNTSSPESLVAGVTANDTTTGYSIVLVLDRN